jgi:hypothetical protein
MDRAADVNSQLAALCAQMRTRVETDVLVVLDDVADPDGVISQLPQHDHFYAIITTNTKLSGTTKCSFIHAGPLPETSAVAWLSRETNQVALAELSAAVGYVPILLQVASALLRCGTCTAKELTLKILSKQEGEALSISKTLELLVNCSLCAIEARHPGTSQRLGTVAVMNTRHISATLLNTILGESATPAVEAITDHAILQRCWDQDGFSMHPTVAAAVMQASKQPIATILSDAAQVLMKLWPRRWRGMSPSAARDLVEHTLSVSDAYQSAAIPLSAETLTSMDRSATFLAHAEGKELVVAAKLWRQMLAHMEVGEEYVRVARDCGRLLHYLKRDSAEEVLRMAYDGAKAIYGKDSHHAALTLAILGVYLPNSEDSIAQFRDASDILEKRLYSPDDVLGKEECRMLQESIFVLKIREGQAMKAVGRTIPDELKTSLSKLRSQLMTSTKTKT